MKFRARHFAWIFAVLVSIPIVALALQSQRAQLGIAILINVTPNPLAVNQGPGASDRIIAKATLRGAPAEIERAFEAHQLHFTQSTGMMVAQTAQKAVKVEAEITPNPNATLLTTDAPGSTVILNAEAGMPVTFPCVYHVKVQTTVTSWQLKHGLSADFTNGSQSFPGGDVANNTYAGATPLPTSTPFAVFSTNGGSFAILGNGSGTVQYCVDLRLSIPIATPQGTFSSNAIYTLYY